MGFSVRNRRIWDGNGARMSKTEDLKSYIRALGRVAVAFSSGVDSTFLLKVAHDTLGDDCIALTAVSPSFPRAEREEAEAFCKAEGIRQIFFDPQELKLEDYASNPKDRCYHCKKALFTKMLELADANGISSVLEGSNVDDLGDYRPGLRAIEELGVLSPLREVGFTKQQIRDASGALGLSTQHKASFACLASRFPYGERITAEGLQQVEQAEEALRELGLHQYRVRKHGDVARIEVPAKDISYLASEEVRSDLVKRIRESGFRYVSLDLTGYRMGSLGPKDPAG